MFRNVHSVHFIAKKMNVEDVALVMPFQKNVFVTF